MRPITSPDDERLVGLEKRFIQYLLDRKIFIKTNKQKDY